MLVIFDCDGVLVDSEVIASRVLAAELSRLGHPITSGQVRARFTGKRMRDVLAEVAETGVEIPDGFLPALKQRDMEAFKAGLEPIPFVRGALRELPHRRCVASSGSMEKMTFTLTHTGLMPYLTPYLFSAFCVENGKPAPDVFLRAAREMGAPPPDCVVIEDSAAGVTAGKAAGMRVLGFTGGAHVRDIDGYPDRLRGLGADAVFSDMRRLNEFL